MVQITKSTKPESQKSITRKWKLIDLEGKILGRAANEIAAHLIGKSKVTYVPYLDGGDNVVVINAKKVTISGRKAEDKEYTFFSGYPGGLRRLSFKALLEKNPDKLIRHAVTGMLPKNKLRDQRLARLHVFPDAKHTFNDKFNKAK